MNDLITPLVQYPVEYGYYYFTRVFWSVFAAMVFVTCLRHAFKIWDTHRWWSRQNDGLGLQAKLVVSEGLFGNAVWKTAAAGMLVASAVAADQQMLFGDLPRPEVATQNALITTMLLTFIFCLYMAVRSTARIDTKLRIIELAQDEASREIAKEMQEEDEMADEEES